MKKVITILAVVFCTIIFNSCTDETDNTIELIETENEIELQLIDKRELGGDPEDHE